jgi:hypothetical protein
MKKWIYLFLKMIFYGLLAGIFSAFVCNGDMYIWLFDVIVIDMVLFAVEDGPFKDVLNSTGLWKKEEKK